MQTVRPSERPDGKTGEVILNNVDNDDVDGAEGAEQGDLEEHGVIRPNLLASPNPPSRQERLEHAVSHLP